MLTRSTITPGTVRSSAQGSRDVGMRLSSLAVKLVDVPVALGSTIGDSPVTVTVSVTVPTFSCTDRSTVPPTTTTTFSWTNVWNPWRVALTLYGPGARLRNRNLPSRSVGKV